MTKLAAAPKRWTARSMVLIGRAARVLVVDDSHEGVDALAEYLELLGLKVNTAYSGAAAVNRAVVWVPDVVLLDISMPEMDGFTLTRKIKAAADLQSIPVVIHSSLSGSANEQHVRKVGANAYVAKFVASELAEVMRNAMAGAAA